MIFFSNKKSLSKSLSAWVTEQLTHNHASQKLQDSIGRPVWDCCPYFLPVASHTPESITSSLNETVLSFIL